MQCTASMLLHERGSPQVRSDSPLAAECLLAYLSSSEYKRKRSLAVKLGRSMDRFMSAYAFFLVQPCDKYTIALVKSLLKALQTRLAAVALFSLENAQTSARDVPVARAA